MRSLDPEYQKLESAIQKLWLLRMALEEAREESDRHPLTLVLASLELVEEVHERVAEVMGGIDHAVVCPEPGSHQEAGAAA